MNIFDLITQANSGDRAAQRAVEQALGEEEGAFMRMVNTCPATKQAACGGDADAMTTLASYYSIGIGVERNTKTALYWLEKAAEIREDDPTILFNLGRMYITESTEYDKAERLIKRAIACGPIPNVPQEEIDAALEALSILRP